MRDAMVMAIGISALIGGALGLRWNVFILIPTIILAVLSTAVIEAASGHQALFVALTIVLVAAAIQISYLGVSIARAAVVGLPVGRNAGLALDIQEHMEVVGSDGEHVGTIDYAESAGRIVLTGDPNARGKPHLISVNLVDYVDSKVHLNKSLEKVVLEWKAAA
jgi:hypothetical protein